MLNDKRASDHHEETPLRYLGHVGKLVDIRINKIQDNLFGSNSDSYARAQLAKLRQSASLTPGSDPSIWELTYDPNTTEKQYDDPTWSEVAIHVSMTTYALHQQSRTKPMHVPGIGFGKAMHMLIGDADENPSIRARFNALVTTNDMGFLRYQLRAIASLLRANEIPLDYAMLADDIFKFQNPEKRDAVRLKWSRQYYQFASQTDRSLDK